MQLSWFQILPLHQLPQELLPQQARCPSSGMNQVLATLTAMYCPLITWIVKCEFEITYTMTYREIETVRLALSPSHCSNVCVCIYHCLILMMVLFWFFGVVIVINRKIPRSSGTRSATFDSLVAGVQYTVTLETQLESGTLVLSSERSTAAFYTSKF